LHRWARLLTQQTSITVYRLPTKEKNFRFPYAENKRKFADSVSRIYTYVYLMKRRQIYRYIDKDIDTYIYCIYLYLYINSYTYIYMPPFQAENGKRKFIVYPFVYEETD
jgi:hypothetical protein